MDEVALFRGNDAALHCEVLVLLDERGFSSVLTRGLIIGVERAFAHEKVFWLDARRFMHDIRGGIAN